MCFCLSEVELLYINDKCDTAWSAFYGVLVPLILSIMCHIGCALRWVLCYHKLYYDIQCYIFHVPNLHLKSYRIIRNTDRCRHRKVKKLHEANSPEAIHNREICDQVETNSGYQELGELSQPTIYEKIKWKYSGLLCLIHLINIWHE